MPAPCDSSFASTNASIGVRTRSSDLAPSGRARRRACGKTRTGGASSVISGASAFVNAPFGGRRHLPSVSAKWPLSIHCRSVRISASLKGCPVPGGGMAVACDLAHQDALLRKALHHHRAVLCCPSRAEATVRRSRPAIGFPAPWHCTQRAWKIGSISFSKRALLFATASLPDARRLIRRRARRQSSWRMISICASGSFCS